MDQNSLYYIIAAVFVIVGLIGTILPAIPGLPLMFVGMVIAAWADDFSKVSILTLVFLGILTVLSFGVDFMAARMGAKRVGASKYALIGAVLGTFGGIFFGPLGLFVGPFVGAAVGELFHIRDIRRATHVGIGTTLGIIVGIVFKLGLAFAMLGLFAFAWFTGSSPLQ